MGNLINCPVCAHEFRTRRMLSEMDGSTIECPGCGSSIAIFSEYGKLTIIVPVCDGCHHIIMKGEEFIQRQPAVRGSDVLCLQCAKEAA